MKRNFLSAALATLALLVTSCLGNSGSTNTEDTDTTSNILDFVTLEKSDSLMVTDYCNANFSIKCQYPVSGEQCLVDSIKRWINDMLFADSEGQTQFLPSGDISKDMEAAIRTRLKADTADLSLMIKSNEEYGIEEPDLMEYSHIYEISVVFEDSMYVTLNANLYDYQGGAHGSTANIAATFSKEDGHRMGWELTSGYTNNELTTRIKASLVKYFEITPNDGLSLRDCLLDIDQETFTNNFPLPVTPPYLMEDGVHLTYQQYEIACYAAGMPEAVIPLKK